METNHNQTLPLGTVLDSGKQKYEIKDVLGMGGFGITYLAESTLTMGNIKVSYKVAIKEFFISASCYRKEGSTEMLCTPTTQGEVAQSKADFITEAKRLQSLCQKSRNIVKVNETFEANGTAYYVMEYLDGGNPGKMTEEEAVKLIKQLAQAVVAVHSEKLLHLDIKPENIVMKTENGDAYPVLIDFGIAKHFDSKGNPTSRVFAKGASQGYAPMEQYADITEFAPGIDVYALGAVLLYLLTGQNPPSSFKISEDQHEIKEMLPDSSSETTKNVILKSMRQKASDRFQSMEEMEKALDSKEGNSYAEPLPINSPSVTQVINIPEEKKTSRTWIYIAIGALIVIGGIFILIFCGNNENLSPEELYEKGKEYYDNEQYTQAVEYFQKSADQGNADAQYRMGDCYYNGYGVTADYQKAFEWYQKAAQQGNVLAECNLGYCYLEGEGVDQDFQKSYEWSKKAAEGGNAIAQSNLGVCYELGVGVEQDSEEAVAWYRKAADQGDDAAQYNLGRCYEKGMGITQNYEKAVEWYQKAADQGYAKAQCSLAYCYDKGIGVSQNYKKAVEWYQKAADQGFVGAQCNLGYCYEKGLGVSQDYQKAFELYQLAADQGLDIAQNNLGNFYEHGKGITQDINKAIYYYQLAADQGFEFAIDKLKELKK